MANRKVVPLKFGADTVYMEVSDVEAKHEAGGANGDPYKDANALSNKVKDIGGHVTSTVRAMASTVQQALDQSKPREWWLEIELGFDGKTGIPYVAEGGVNGSVKIRVKWERPAS